MLRVESLSDQSEQTEEMFLQILMDYFLAGEDQQQTNQPNDQPVAGG